MIFYKHILKTHINVILYKHIIKQHIIVIFYKHIIKPHFIMIFDKHNLKHPLLNHFYLCLRSLCSLLFPASLLHLQGLHGGQIWYQITYFAIIAICVNVSHVPHVYPCLPVFTHVYHCLPMLTVFIHVTHVTHTLYLQTIVKPRIVLTFFGDLCWEQ